MVLAGTLNSGVVATDCVQEDTQEGDQLKTHL